MNNQLSPLSFGRLALIACVGLVCCATTRADEIPSVAGQWKITFPNGSVNVYTIDRHGRMQGTVGGKPVSGRAVRQNDNFTQLTFQGSDALERLWINPGDNLAVGHFDHKADFPTKNAAQVGSGVRLRPVPPASQSEPNVKISDVAGQWSVAYNNTAVHVYTFDKAGQMGGWESDGQGNDVQLTGQILEKDGRLLLNHYGSQPGQIPPLERLTMRVDGRLVVEQWNPRAGFDSGSNPNVVGLGVPVSGKSGPGIEALDAVMLKYLEKIGCSGATATVTRGNHTYCSRGYGWSDAEHNVPIQPDTPMSIASCDKEMTMAAIRQLARDGKLDLNASVLKVLQTKPLGKVVDNRVWDITINHLLDGKAGWQGAPLTQADTAYAAIQGKNGVPGPDSLLSFDTRLGLVMTQKLAWTPGTKAEYDSFGYGMLKLIITRVSGQSYVDYLRHQLCRPYGVPELKWIRHGARQKGEPPQLWNELIMEDPRELRMGVSMPALCTFMRCFWHGGEPAGTGSTNAVWGGSWDNATTLMLWRNDGINIAYSFNGRAADADAETEMHQAINWMLAEQKIPAK